MLKHIVMMKLVAVDPADKKSNLENLIEMLEELPKHISVVKHLEVGKNFSTRPTAMDLILVTEFDGEKELDAYRVHPKHKKVLEFIKEVVNEARVVDYWI